MMSQLRVSDPLERTFSNYVLKSCLGSGSFGVVWKVRQKNNEMESALKFSLAEKGDWKRQKREFEIAVQLHHENLVKAHEWNKKEITAAELDNLIPENSNCHNLIAAVRGKRNVEIYWMRMELCGENLRSWLQETHDPFEKEVQDSQHKIVRGVIEGLNYLHSQRIMHRDLKPENILFFSNGFQLPVKIGDYGTSRIRSETLTSTLTSSMGTDLYKSPEAWSNKYDFRSDIFSLGLIIWEVIQFIPIAELKSHFDRIVYDKQEDLVKPAAKSIDFIFSPLVKKMCLRDVKQRMENLEYAIDRLACHFMATSSQELEEILKNCCDGWTIKLGEGTFHGRFIIAASNVTIFGEGVGTILTTAPPCALALTGNRIKCSDFQIDGGGSSGISVIGNQCSFERINISNCVVGIIFKTVFGKIMDIDKLMNPNYYFHKTKEVSRMDKFLGLKKDNVHRRRESIAHLSVLQVSIDTTEIGILLCDIGNATLSEVMITNPGKCGIFFYNVHSIVELSGVRVDVTPHFKVWESFSHKLGIFMDLFQSTKTVSTTRPNSLYGIIISGSPSGKFDFQKVKCTGFNGGKGPVAGLLVEDDSEGCRLEMEVSRIEKIVFGNDFPV